MSFKIVALVLALSLAVVFVGSRMIDKGLIPSFNTSAVNEVSPTVPTKPSTKNDTHQQRGATKQSLPAEPANEPFTTGNVPLGEVRVPEQGRDVPQRIQPGMLRTQVLELFGNPTLRVIETRNGKVMERFIYVDLKRQTKTIAVLENGRTVRLNTGPYVGVN
jgi:hypothetical protein